MPFIITSTYSTDEYYPDYAVYMIVEITPDLLKRLEQAHRALDAALSADPASDRLEFFDYRARFVRDNDDPQMDFILDDTVLAAGEWRIIDTWPIESSDEPRTEYMKLVVDVDPSRGRRPHTFSWKMCVKHTSAEISGRDLTLTPIVCGLQIFQNDLQTRLNQAEQIATHEVIRRKRVDEVVWTPWRLNIHSWSQWEAFAVLNGTEMRVAFDDDFGTITVTSTADTIIYHGSIP